MPDKQRQIVLCFDGTGNTFQADGTDTNVLKICRMLVRTDDQCKISLFPLGTLMLTTCTGIGTDITPGSLASTTIQKRGKIGNSKALNLALGKSFDRHVLGGYRFLMRHYCEGTRIFIFGFSRGAYTARFLNEMLDYVGLLGPDNEEVLPFVWDAFAGWKLSKNNEREEKRKAFSVMKACRETLSRPMPRVHFLGMFDAVNSVADFEVNIDTMPATKIVRHAVSIDERRTKFRPVLLRQLTGDQPDTRKPRRLKHHLPDISHKTQKSKEDGDALKVDIPQIHICNDAAPGSDIPGKPTESAPSKCQDVRSDNDDDDDGMQDAEEIWFPGGHADVGGGWNLGADEDWPLSHAPLVWMVQEALRAGLLLDPDKMKQFECNEGYDSDNVGGSEKSPAQKNFLNALHLGATKGVIHDLLEYGDVLPFTSVLSWRLMEYLPLRRMELQPDGKWKDVMWPPPRGEPRHIPWNAKLHVSAIKRMKSDPSYRPANLTWGWSKEADTAITDTGDGPWMVHEYEGDPVRETYIMDRDKLRQYTNNKVNGS
ncbi:hypothetical protein PHISCL_06174 [Aspergillus sclerotialis]|uniref:T6SS Phospholipase effector Tle1-like catalytic domain-containing protein n=1 Tax=Aspergillus sclerotialis TaxID=2070753 RepID=A0A3A2ZEA5_9EURO|nr:hypothetical protein PHISCL_06174 [Aspergillus sclerotialis]